MVIESPHATSYSLALVIFDLRLLNRLRLDLNLPIESPYTTSYFMEIVMLARSDTILDIFAVEICMTFNLTLECAQVKCKNANGKAVCDFLFVDDSNVCDMLPSARYSVEMCMTWILTFRLG